MNELQKAIFTIDGEGGFTGFTRGQTWNGWECPYFTKEVAEQVFQFFMNSDCKLWYVEEVDTYYMSLQWFGETEEEDVEYWQGHEYIIDGEKVVLYSVGAFSWTWDCEYI